MDRILQNFIDGLLSASNLDTFRNAMADAATALDLSCFAYLSIPDRADAAPRIISTYQPTWTKQYVQRRYERFDPVIIRALSHRTPFEWGARFRAGDTV